ncbi:ATP-binding protein [Microcoleus sp. C2C3]|jgi:serine/threonine-protein kinase RsbW|uniref:ATP-binding protein n=1 Tax=unclassified Microcoleus TaxID=2642155 RepID=UPI002FD4826C
MKDEQPKAEWHLQVETDMKALTSVLEWWDNIVLPGLPADFQWPWQCRLIIAEGFTNVVRHAHQNLPPATLIDLEVKVFADYLEIRIWDRGQPFKLEAKLHSIMQEKLDPSNQVGGRGLVFMYKLTDDLRYIRTDDLRNCLVMRKNIT